MLLQLLPLAAAVAAALTAPCCRSHCPLLPSLLPILQLPLSPLSATVAAPGCHHCRPWLRPLLLHIAARPCPLLPLLLPLAAVIVAVITATVASTITAVVTAHHCRHCCRTLLLAIAVAMAATISCQHRCHCFMSLLLQLPCCHRRRCHHSSHCGSLMACTPDNAAVSAVITVSAAIVIACCCHCHCHYCSCCHRCRHLPCLCCHPFHPLHCLLSPPLLLSPLFLPLLPSLPFLVWQLLVP